MKLHAATSARGDQSSPGLSHSISDDIVHVLVINHES